MIKLKFPIVFIVCLLAIPVSAEKFSYTFSNKDTLSYALSADSRVDLNKLGAIAAILQISNLSQNTYIVADLTREEADKSGGCLIKALFRQVSLVMIKNDSVHASSVSNWGEIKPGAIHRFSMAADGKIQPVLSKSGQLKADMIALWQFIFPIFPGRSLAEKHNWADTVKFPFQMTGTAPIEVICKINYTYVGKDGNADNFEYSLQGESPQNKNLYISGAGHIRFDNRKGRLLENSCDFEMRGMIDLTTMGLPAELNSSLPLSIKSKAIAKLQNAN
jgi:hypothetical protein